MTYTVLTQGPLDEAFLISEAPGHRSREVVTLKSGAKYQAGSVLAAEYDAGTPQNGETPAIPPAPTGYYVLASDTALDGAVLCRTTDATDEATDAAVIARDAEVKDSELVLKSGTSLAEATAILAATGIIVRKSI